MRHWSFRLCLLHKRQTHVIRHITHIYIINCLFIYVLPLEFLSWFGCGPTDKFELTTVLWLSKVRTLPSFCWYLWNCWPSLFKLPIICDYFFQASLVDQDLSLMKQLLTLNETIEELKNKRLYGVNKGSLDDSTCPVMVQCQRSTQTELH